MRKYILTGIAGIFIGSIFMSCQSDQKKLEAAKESVAEAKGNLAETKNEIQDKKIENWESFRAAENEKIMDNNKKLAALRKKKFENREEQVKYNEKIAALEKKNNALRTKLNNYTDGDKDNAKWESFKREFNHDMNELGTAFKDLTVNNKN